MVHVLLVVLALHGTIAPVSRAELGASWHPGCPVVPAQFRQVTVSYWGFDGARHSGALVVDAAVASRVAAIFERLFRSRFPIRRIVPVAAYGGSDDRSMAADNTSAFNCRYAVAPGPRRWSVHAYGEAIDVNPVENPYLEGGKVLPPAGRRYVDRTMVRPGMAVPAGRSSTRSPPRAGSGAGAGRRLPTGSISRPRAGSPSLDRVAEGPPHRR